MIYLELFYIFLKIGALFLYSVVPGKTAGYCLRKA